MDARTTPRSRRPARTARGVRESGRGGAHQGQGEIERIVSQRETADHPLVAELVERWWDSADHGEVVTAVSAAGVPKERLLEKAASESESVAWAAIRRLDGAADAREVEVLRAAVDRFGPDLGGARQEAMTRLRYIGTPEARKVLLDRAFVVQDALLADHAWLVRHRAEAVPWLIEKLSDDVWHLNAVHALGQAHAVEAVEPLCAAARTAEFPWAHADALSTITAPEAMPTLIELAEHDDSRVRHDALVGLGRIGGPEVVGAVLKACDDPEPRVRFRAARVLAKCGDERAVPALIRLCDVPEHAARAADALGRIGDSRALPTLWSMFLNPDSPKDARHAAGRALATIDCPMRTTYSDDASVARACAWLLGRTPRWDSRHELEALARHTDPLVRLRAAEAFGRLGTQPVRALLDDPDHRVRTCATHALARSTSGPARSS